MTNAEIVITILMACGFAYVGTRLNKLEDMCSLLISINLSKMAVKGQDGDTISFTIHDGEE